MHTSHESRFFNGDRKMDDCTFAETCDRAPYTGRPILRSVCIGALASIAN